MPDPFARLIPDARAFLAELAVHNSRDWFAGQKNRYDTTVKAPAQLLLDQVAYDLGRQTGVPLTPKLFRPQRDVRFSKDKTPYHTHLHMMWSIGGSGPKQPALFFGLSPDYVKIGGGIMGFDKTTLTGWRNAVDGPFGDQVHQVLDDLAMLGLAAAEPELKRIPAPFGKDTRHGDLLRRKSLTLWRDVPDARFGAPQAALSEVFTALAPMLALLDENL